MHVAYCPSGQELKSGACQDCAIGFWKNNTINPLGACTMCANNTVTLGTGATTKDNCSQGMHHYHCRLQYHHHSHHHHHHHHNHHHHHHRLSIFTYLTTITWCSLLVGTNWFPLLISPWTKWSPFRSRYFQTHFREWKVCNLIKIWLKFVPKGPIDNNRALV